MKKILFSFLIVFILGSCSLEAPRVYFDTGDGETYQSVLADTKGSIEMPTEPLLTGYEFDGWYFDNNHFKIPFYSNSLLGLEIETDIKVYAKWLPIEYTIIFDDASYSNLIYNRFREVEASIFRKMVPDRTITLKYKEPIPTEILDYLRSTDFYKRGYEFAGWNIQIPSKMPANDITLSMNFEPVQKEISIFLKTVLKPRFIDIEVLENNKGIALLSDDNRVYIGYNQIKFNDQYTDLELELTEITDQIELQKDEKVIKAYPENFGAMLLTDFGRLLKIQFRGNEETRIYVTGILDLTSYFKLNDDEKITQFNTSKEHSIASTSRNRVFSWGSNSHGQLGNESEIYHEFPNDITLNFPNHTGAAVLQIAVSEISSAILFDNGEIYYWGKFDEMDQFNYPQLIELSDFNSNSNYPMNRFINIVWNDLWIGSPDTVKFLKLTNATLQEHNSTRVGTPLNTPFSLIVSESNEFLYSIFPPEYDDYYYIIPYRFSGGSKSYVMTREENVPLDIIDTACSGCRNSYSGAVLTGIYLISSDGEINFIEAQTWRVGRQPLPQIPFTIQVVSTSQFKLVETRVVGLNEVITLPLLNQEGYVLNGWYLDRKLSNSLNSLLFDVNSHLIESPYLFAEWVPTN